MFVEDKLEARKSTENDVNILIGPQRLEGFIQFTVSILVIFSKSFDDGVDHSPDPEKTHKPQHSTEDFEREIRLVTRLNIIDVKWDEDSPIEAEAGCEEKTANSADCRFLENFEVVPDYESQIREFPQDETSNHFIAHCIAKLEFGAY